MFEFTTENLLNDLSRVSVETPATSKAVPTGGKGFRVKGVNTFIASQMSPVWKNVGTASTKEVVGITIPAITAGLYRLNLPIVLAGSADADYSRHDIDYGKPVQIEFELPAGQSATQLAALIQKNFTKTTQAAVHALQASGTGSVISITAGNEYVRLGKAKIEKLDETTQLFVPFSTATAVTTAGNAGFGTAWDLTKNFRLPTQEATYLTAENLDERPIAGTLYNQYTFRYEAARNINGTGVLGEKAASVTTHVFFVLSNLATAFEALITGAGAVVADARGADGPVDFEQGQGTKAQDPEVIA